MTNHDMKQLELGEIPALEDILIPTDETDKESFVIDTEGKATWASKKILESEARVDHYSQLSKEYKARIDSWFQKAVKKETDSSAYLRTLIKPFIEKEVSKQSKSKTIHLPGVAVQLKKKPDRIDVSDPDLALSFCEVNHPEAVVIKKDVSKPYLKNLLNNQGEIIPGTEIKVGEQELYFKEEE